ncbi:LysR family transcriptional regulator [Alteromonas sp. D210916BOD_24]
MLNIRHLLCALEIKRCGTMTEASKHVHLSQSALTQAINKLETVLGEKIFERSSGGMFTNAAGELFLERVRRAFSYLNSFASSLFEQDRTKSKGFIRGVSARQLTTLIAVAELQSYTAAAVKLNLTQPTLAKAIKDLEHLCEQALFQRIPKGVEPTWRARQLARFASLFFSEINQGLEEINELTGLHAGTLTVGSLPLARSELVPETVVSLLKDFPSAQISIIDGPYDEQLSALLHGQLDVIVGALRETLPGDDVEQFGLFDNSLRIVARVDHPAQSLLHQPTLDKSLLEYQWIAPREGTPTRTIFNSLFKSEGLTPPRNVIECSSLVAVRSLLLKSDCLALLSAKQITLEAQAGILTFSDFLVPHSERTIGFTLRKQWKPTPLQAKFLERLKTISAEL